MTWGCGRGIGARKRGVMGSKMGDISVILSTTTNIEKEGNVLANK